MHPIAKNMEKFKAKISNAFANLMRLKILKRLHNGEKRVCEIIPIL